ncbi:MAG TPA: FAD-dependent oxidoreductase [Phycisphaerales bacterium]|nr:FAD-dependent oxidoreductase [Phycisphaerales bacterium]
MPKLTIDNLEVEVETGGTILDAANALGVDIPSMCFLKGCTPSTSCMVCVVKVEGIGGMVPACATVVTDAMVVHSETDEIRKARTTALELLLSDHLGDCMGPCHVTCPATMDIPLMIRQIADGNMQAAIETVKKDIALPAILGRICPAPCERSCRRASHDQAVSICLLKRYVADIDLASDSPFSPFCQPKKGKSVAIIGAGPAGLSAAYYLLQQGYDCTIFDDHEKPGGMIRYGVSREQLAAEVIDREIARIEKLGAAFKFNCRVGTDISIEKIRDDFHAVFIAAGQIACDEGEYLGVEVVNNSMRYDRTTYQTNLDGVFAGGDVTGKRQIAVRASAHGKEAAVSMGQYLSGEKVTGSAKPFNSRIGKMDPEELNGLVASVSDQQRITPSQNDGGFDDEQAIAESLRCLHCDCRKPATCKLRQYSLQYAARGNRYKSQRRRFVQQLDHPEIIYESGKCIDCGLCIQIARQNGEALGLSFIGRGFDVKVATPFGRSIADGLKKSAGKCVQACPTGALAFNDNRKK